MIDLLLLAAEPLRDRTIEEQPKSKSSLFEEILLRLHERNLLNEIAIKKHIRKSKKRKINDLDDMKLSFYDHESKPEAKMNEPSIKQQKIMMVVERQDARDEQEHEAKEVQFNDLHDTNHTLSDEVELRGEEIRIRPTLKLQLCVLPQRKGEKDLQGAQQFTKYLRHFFHSKIMAANRKRTSYETPKIIANQIETTNNPIESLPTRFQIKPKSINFDSFAQQVQQLSTNNQGFCTKERIRTEQYSSCKDFEQRNNPQLRKRGTLPCIHQRAVQNKRRLQNYIRMNNSKPNKHSVTLQKHIGMEINHLSGTQSIKQKRVMTKLNTMQIRKT